MQNRKINSFFIESTNFDFRGGGFQRTKRQKYLLMKRQKDVSSFVFSCLLSLLCVLRCSIFPFFIPLRTVSKARRYRENGRRGQCVQADMSGQRTWGILETRRDISKFERNETRWSTIYLFFARNEGYHVNFNTPLVIFRNANASGH